MTETKSIQAGERTQHTSGPWIENLDETAERINAVIGPDWQVVCDNVYGEDKNKAAANMRLIAAAPELLATLRALATSELTIDRDHNRTPERLAIREGVWAVIQKAEGK